MPPKKASIGRSTSKARKRKASQQAETDEQREARLASNRLRNAETRSSASVEQREIRLETDRVRTAQARNSETVQHKESRLVADRIRTARVRHMPHVDLNLGAFHYDESAARFAKQLLDIGNGKIAIDQSTHCIKLPTDFCKLTANKDELIQKVFPTIARNYKNHHWLSERAILAAKNIDVNDINFTIQNGIPGEAITYKSIDTVMNHDEVVNYPTEFLNSLDLPGMPPHILKLKIGVPIILLRNINPPRLCNGTRLSVKKLMNNIIEATILNGKFKGEDVLLPRIPMIPTDMPFEFKRLQFPVRLAFAMTINKAQGQSLQVCGLELESPCFSHGQLYVACSRVGKPSDLFVNAPEGKTRNIVYPQALE